MKVPKILCAAFLVFISGCGEQPENSQASQSIEVELAEIESAKINPATPEDVSEVFAIGGDSTDLQRDILRKELTGSVVRWRLQVYDVEFDEGIYKVTSQALPVKSKQAVQLLRAVVFIVPTGHGDHDLMRKTKTNDVITVRGKVKDLVLRTLLVIDPAVLVIENAEATQGKPLLPSL